MKNLINSLLNKATGIAVKASTARKPLTFGYTLAATMATVANTVTMATPSQYSSNPSAYPMWIGVDKVLGIVYPILIFIGVVLIVVGIGKLLMDRMNDQSITSDILFLGAGIVLILIRAVVGPAIEDVAFEQMYPTTTP